MAVYLALAVRVRQSRPCRSTDVVASYNRGQYLLLSLQVLRDQHAMADALQNRRLGHPLGQTLLGKTALLVGFGNIAVELVPRCVTCSWVLGVSS